MKNPDSDRLYNDAWDDYFRQQFADFQSDPPADALDRILAGLPTAPTPTPPSATGGRNLTWLWSGLGILLFLLGGLVLHQQRWQARSNDLTASLTDKQISAALVPTERKHSSVRTMSQSTRRTEPVETSKQTANVRQFLVSDEPATVTNVPARASSVTADRPASKPLSENAVSQRAIRRPQRANEAGAASTELGENMVEPSFAARKLNEPVEKVTSYQFSIQTGQTLETDVTQTNQVFKKAADQLKFLNTNDMRSLSVRLALPAVKTSAVAAVSPKQPDVSRQKLLIFASVMPLYAYQRINPIPNDDVWVKSVSTQKTLSAQRAGIRLQAGIELPVNRQFSVRTSLLYNQLSQSVSYTTPSDRPDSVRVERVDANTVRLTPYYKDKQVSQQTQWHYVGVGADFVWRVGSLGSWRHYATAGTSVGTYLSQQPVHIAAPISGFLQASYGIERQLTPVLWLRVAPTVQYGLNTVSDAEGLFRIRPYTYGLTIGIRR